MEVNPQVQLVQQITMPLFQVKGWMKLLGVVMIVQGIVAVFTIVGIIICWLPIWLGVLLFQAAGFAETAQLTGDSTQLIQALSKIKTYFVINGVLMLITLVMFGLMLLISGGALLGTLGQF